MPAILPTSSDVAFTGSSRGGLPATGIVLIGTRRTCRYLAGQLGALREPAIPAGCVAISVLDGAGAATNTGGGVADGVGILPPQLGTVDDLIGLHGRYQFRFALVCLPDDVPGTVRTRLSQLLTQLEIAHRFVPTAEELILGRGGQDGQEGQRDGGADTLPAVGTRPGLRPRGAPAVRPMLPEDIDPVVLIGRSGVTIDSAAVSGVIAGKTVLITGAGGSIGSQLAQIVAKFNPAGIVLMERAENALFQIDQVMGRRFPTIKRRCILHDVVERDATRRLLGELRPDVVFHAAAHKHVPLMEDHPSLALSNNLFGTAAMADAAAACGAERFVLISTDKAVNPSSAMGASKRLAELFIASRAAESSGGPAGTKHTIFSAVRFGNVLASACSVVPIWLQQMADGAPISVTDPRMTRYFMTIPEAASLVVQAAALQREAGAAPIFVLDMGRPIRILDLACRFVRMHGAVPRLKRVVQTGDGGVRQAALDAAVAEIGGWPVLEASLGLGEDADGAGVTIELTGARPGEKLYEELAYAREQLQPTSHVKINRQAAERAADSTFADRLLAALAPLRTDGADKVEVVRAMMEWVGADCQIAK